jgi:hypothetical protein
MKASCSCEMIFSSGLAILNYLVYTMCCLATIVAGFM